jgi:hypothetical protein
MIKRKKELNFDQEYPISQFQICPFEKLKVGDSSLIHPLRNEGYEYVIGVMDAKNNRVIEIANGHSYKYIEMISGYMLNKQRIIDNKRYAICPVYVSKYELTNDEIKRINEITRKLSNNEEFIDGNYVMTNSEYRDSIIEYKNQEKQRFKIKKKIKGK